MFYKTGLLVTFITCFYLAVQPETYIGKWKLHSGSVIEIYEKNDIFYGKIFKRADRPKSNINGLDNQNPNPKFRSRPLLGKVILKNLYFESGILDGGTIYNADNGKTYPVKLEIEEDNPDCCHIRVYKGFLFKTFEAIRVK